MMRKQASDSKENSKKLNNFENLDNSRKNNKFKRMRGRPYKGVKKTETGYKMSELRKEKNTWSFL